MKSNQKTSSVRRVTTFQFFLCCVSLVFASLAGQPAPRFQPLDWVVFRRVGALYSFSEGFEYLYMATQMGGVYRWHILRKEMADPITVAQGLESNRCEAVLFDRDTRTLWVATQSGLNFSYNPPGEWHFRPKEELGLLEGNHVDRIGASRNYLWMFVGTHVAKLDRSTGALVGELAQPDEPLLQISSGHRDWTDVPSTLAAFSITDGWLFNGNDVVDDYGRLESITTFYTSRYQDVFLGTDHGTLLVGDAVLQQFQPHRVGLLNRSVGDIEFDDQALYLAGDNRNDPPGITVFADRRNQFRYWESDLVSNAPHTAIHALSWNGSQLWTGGEEIAVYDAKHSFWKNLGQPVQGSRVLTLSNGALYEWAGTDQNLVQIDTSRYRITSSSYLPLNLNDPVTDVLQFDQQIWVTFLDGFLSINEATGEYIDRRFHRQLDLAPGIIRYDALAKDATSLLVATSVGVFRTSPPGRRWKRILQPSEYGARMIRTMDWNGSWGVLNLGTTFLLFSGSGNVTHEYQFPFLGKIHCIYFDGDVIWLGTNQGLIRFKWVNEQFQ
ncbi:MAG: hypothetical protein D6762_01090 [Candidatus Neomarinimicrobiota bacterium]|nr:MAG: hypothetical protein D6762_01090 [Candidatus Neomarinimicrobiota bacterium]